MADPVELIGLIAARALPVFPTDHDWPLVAAAIVPSGGDAILYDATNIGRLLPLPTGGITKVHAEEALLVQPAPGLHGPPAIEVVVTSEPCDRKGTGDKQPCARKIVAFAQAGTFRVDRVVVGAFVNGIGLRQMTRAGLKVVLLHGDEHAPHMEKDVAEPLRQAASEAAQGGGITVISAAMDPLNREGYRRKGVARAEEKAQVDSLLAWIEAQLGLPDEELVERLLAEHPRFFQDGERETLLDGFRGTWRDERGDFDREACRGGIEGSVNRECRRERRVRAEAELRGRVQ